MTEGIIIAVITGIFAVIGSVIGQWAITNKARKEDEVRQAVLNERTDNRLKSIEKKLDEHNHYAEKLGCIQQDIASIRTEINNLKEAAK